MFEITNGLMPLLLLNMVFLIESQYPYYGDDLSTLGERINAQVQRDLAPLQGLGARINAQVENNMRHIGNDLSTLGERISSKVEEGLKPVRALEVHARMMDGVGGHTVVTHLPSRETFVAKNSKIYKCKGEIDHNTGSCSGNLEPFAITSSSPKTDWCFLRGYSQVNDHICLSTNGISVSVINNIVQCTGSFNSDVLVLTLDEYKKMCSTVSQTVEYRYFPDVNSRIHVPIPNSNPYVKCDNSGNNVCIFQRRNPLLTVQYSRHNSLVINNYNSY